MLQEGQERISRTWTFLARTLGVLGKYDEAEEIAHAAFDGTSEELEPEHPYTLVSLSVWARMLRLQKNYLEASRLGEQARDGPLRVLRKYHTDLLITTFDLARVRRAEGQEEAAMKTAWDVMDGRYEMLGDQHPSTLEEARRFLEEVQGPEIAPAET